MNENFGYEITDYSDPEMNFADVDQVIRQIMVDMVNDVPSIGVRADMTGDRLKLHYIDFVINLPVHLKEVAERGDTALKELAKHIKAEFKSRTKKTLRLKELKDLSSYTVEKVSLNERYYYRTWKVYEVDFK